MRATIGDGLYGVPNSFRHTQYNGKKQRTIEESLFIEDNSISSEYSEPSDFNMRGNSKIQEEHPTP